MKGNSDKGPPNAVIVAATSATGVRSSTIHCKISTATIIEIHIFVSSRIVKSPSAITSWICKNWDSLMMKAVLETAKMALRSRSVLCILWLSIDKLWGWITNSMIRGTINPRTMYAIPSSGGTTQLEQNTVDEDNEDPNVMGAISYTRRHWLCKESTTGPTVEPAKKRFAAVARGGSRDECDGSFMEWCMDKLSLPFHHSCHFHAIITNNEQVAQVKLSNSEIRYNIWKRESQGWQSEYYSLKVWILNDFPKVSIMINNNKFALLWQLNITLSTPSPPSCTLFRVIKSCSDEYSHSIFNCFSPQYIRRCCKLINTLPSLMSSVVTSTAFASGVYIVFSSKNVYCFNCICWSSKKIVYCFNVFIAVQRSVIEWAIANKRLW